MPEELMDQQLSDDEMLQKLAEAMQSNAPTPEEKHNVHLFLNKVATALDTTKTGYLRDDNVMNEIGIPKNPVRTYHDLSNWSGYIMDNEQLKKYFLSKAEIITKTSLSRDGFLIKMAVTQKREISDMTPKPKKKNSGWFSKKDKSNEGGEE